MPTNDKYFLSPHDKETYLRARGFGADGSRSGGIRDPRKVDLPSMTTLFRLYNESERKLGEWWFTPHEMKQVVDYFARGGAGFAEGREQGNGILHAVFAIRHDWVGNSPNQIRRFVVVRLRDPLQGYYGDRDDAPDKTQKQNQKPVSIVDDRSNRRFVRQLFIPRPWEYPVAFADLGSHSTDLVLIGAVLKHRRAPLSFEV